MVGLKPVMAGISFMSDTSIRIGRSDSAHGHVKHLVVMFSLTFVLLWSVSVNTEKLETMAFYNWPVDRVKW